MDNEWEDVPADEWVDEPTPAPAPAAPKPPGAFETALNRFMNTSGNMLFIPGDNPLDELKAHDKASEAVLGKPTLRDHLMPTFSPQIARTARATPAEQASIREASLHNLAARQAESAAGGEENPVSAGLGTIGGAVAGMAANPLSRIPTTGLLRSLPAAEQALGSIAPKVLAKLFTRGTAGAALTNLGQALTGHEPTAGGAALGGLGLAAPVTSGLGWLGSSALPGLSNEERATRGLSGLAQFLPGASSAVNETAPFFRNLAKNSTVRALGLGNVRQLKRTGGLDNAKDVAGRVLDEGVLGAKNATGIQEALKARLASTGESLSKLYDSLTQKAEMVPFSSPEPRQLELGVGRGTAVPKLITGPKLPEVNGELSLTPGQKAPWVPDSTKPPQYGVSLPPAPTGQVPLPLTAPPPKQISTDLRLPLTQGDLGVGPAQGQLPLGSPKPQMSFPAGVPEPQISRPIEPMNAEQLTFLKQIAEEATPARPTGTATPGVQGVLPLGLPRPSMNYPASVPKPNITRPPEISSPEQLSFLGSGVQNTIKQNMTPKAVAGQLAKDVIPDLQNYAADQHLVPQAQRIVDAFEGMGDRPFSFRDLQKQTSKFNRDFDVSDPSNPPLAKVVRQAIRRSLVGQRNKLVDDVAKLSGDTEAANTLRSENTRYGDLSTADDAVSQEALRQQAKMAGGGFDKISAAMGLLHRLPAAQATALNKLSTIARKFPNFRNLFLQDEVTPTAKAFSTMPRKPPPATPPPLDDLPRIAPPPPDAPAALPAGTVTRLGPVANIRGNDAFNNAAVLERQFLTKMLKEGKGFDNEAIVNPETGETLLSQRSPYAPFGEGLPKLPAASTQPLPEAVVPATSGVLEPLTPRLRWALGEDLTPGGGTVNDRPLAPTRRSSHRK